MAKAVLGIILLAVVAVGGYFFFVSGNQTAADIADKARSEAQKTMIALYGTSTELVDFPPVEGATSSNSAATSTSMNTHSQAVLHTNKGDITIEFYNELAPKTVENFLKLAKQGYYNGTKFHRVIQDFMIQGGDPLSKDDSKVAQWGTGGPGYTFNDEIHANNHNVTGTISMANAGANTNGSQFFINTADNNFLDTKHTVFGKVTAGMSVVEAIEKAKTTTNDRPVEAIIITSVDVLPQ